MVCFLYSRAAGPVFLFSFLVSVFSLTRLNFKPHSLCARHQQP